MTIFASLTGGDLIITKEGNWLKKSTKYHIGMHSNLGRSRYENLWHHPSVLASCLLVAVLMMDKAMVEMNQCSCLYIFCGIWAQ